MMRVPVILEATLPAFSVLYIVLNNVQLRPQKRRRQNQKGSHESRDRAPIFPVTPLHLQRLENIIEYPAGKTDMPTPPKVGYRCGDVRPVKILGEVNIEKLRAPQRHIGIPRKIAKNLKGKEEGRQQQVGCRAVAHVFVQQVSGH